MMTDAKMLEALKSMLLGMRACPDTDFLRHMRPAMTKAEAAVKEAEAQAAPCPLCGEPLGHERGTHHACALREQAHAAAPTPGVYFHATPK